jgi:primosomal protein N' (replication factor Y)
MQGVVLGLIAEPAVQKTKEILAVVDPEPALTGHQIALAEWMAESTLSGIGTIVDLFLPPGLSQLADTVFEIHEAYVEGPRSGAVALKNNVHEARLLRVLRDRGALRGRQIDRALPRVEWRRAAQSLVRRGVLTSHSILPPATVRPKYVRTAQLAVSPEEAKRAMRDSGSTEATRGRRGAAIGFLLSRPEAINVAWIYAASSCNLSDLQELSERGVIVLREKEVWRDPLEKNGGAGLGPLGRFGAQQLELTEGQLAAWQAVDEGLQDSAAGKYVPPFLLQGVTGSGKTELYVRAALETVGRGQQAIVLVPEISVTPQTVRRFLDRFPGQVGLIHSRLSDGERYDTWRRARAGALSVVIGPRSALFAPLPNLGLLIVDECHDASYKQSEPPFYDAVAAAQAYGRICGGVCVMGSATPNVSQRYQTEIGRGRRLLLTQRIASQLAGEPASELDLPAVDIVDLREELKAGNRSSFSRELTAALGKVLARGEQAILFLNRRGTATYVFCRNCGTVVRCPRCETPLTFHVSSGERLLCHRCGYRRQLPRECGECGSADVRAYGLGTEKVEADVQTAFPKARTLRWDWETTRQKDAHEVILHHFASGHADVLIGTQMLAKGLDLPRVTLVGIIMADVGLHLPDPFAAERVFQVLTQVAGRAGRSKLGGRVLLQTFAPDHYAIQAAARHDVDGFYAHELAERRRLGYPPFTRLLRLEYRHYDAAKAEQTARAVAERLERKLVETGRRHVPLIGPAPCFFSKLDGKYRWQIVLRAAEVMGLVDRRGLAEWRIEVDPVSLL